MTCRAAAIGIKLRGESRDNFAEVLLTGCKSLEDEHRRITKNRAWTATVQELCPLIELVKSIAAEKTDFSFSPAVARLIESCETLPQRALTVCDSTTNILLDSLKAHRLAQYRLGPSDS